MSLRKSISLYIRYAAVCVRSIMEYKLSFVLMIFGRCMIAFTEFLDTHSGEGKLPRKIRAERLLEMAEIPFIYEAFGLARFENRIIYYETSRGCPFGCSYCLSGAA